MIGVSAYVMIAYYAAEVCKTAGVRKKWLPIISATGGLVCGVIGHLISGGAIENIFDSISVGLFSGFAAVGTNEIAKYIFKKEG